jgi:hypothetical protein
VINILRSKQAWESRLYKNRKELGWHKKARPFVDSTINVPELLKFASTPEKVPVGNINDDDRGTGDDQVFPNELLPCHTGMQSGDWVRAVWVCERKLKFDAHGPIVSAATKIEEQGGS